VHKPALLKDNFALFRCGFGYNYTNMFRIDLFWIMYMYRAVFFRIIFLNVVTFTTFEFS